MKDKVLHALFYLLFSSVLCGQTMMDTSFLRVKANLMAQLEAYPQEKVHLHTDRDFYLSGENILLKAYVADAV